MSYVTYKGQKIDVKDGKLDLNSKGIRDITEIEGLETLTSLQILDLSNNQITEIKGLETLTELQKLFFFFNNITEIKGLERLIKMQELSFFANRITEIKGLETLTNLKSLNLGGNKIIEIKGLETLSNLESLDFIRNPIKNEEYYLTNKNAQEVVNYCREKNKEIKERIEKIIETKRKIQNLIFHDEINRCILSNNILHRCGKLNAINDTINVPKILGFFMYEFPKPAQEYGEHKEFYENYSKEIERLKQFFQDLNKSNYFIEIRIPEEATDTLIKTCSFCEIARSYDFGILLMTPPNTNAFLEAGMFMSLGKRVIFLNNDFYPTKPSFDTTSFFYIHYKSLDEIEERWNKKMPKFFNELLKNYLEFDSLKFKSMIDKDDSEDLIKFYEMISHEIEFNKGELISLINRIGNDNFNQYLNMELRKKQDVIEILNEKWNLIMFRPYVPKPYNFIIVDLKLKENQTYRDNTEDYGNKKIYNQFTSYLKNSLTKSLNLSKENSNNLFIENEEENEEVPVNTGLINSIIDMLEKGEVPPSMIHGRYNTIKNECSSIFLRRELNEEIVSCVSRISKHFCKVVSIEDIELLKLILVSLEYFTRKPRLFEILEKNCNLDKLKTIFNGGIIDSNLVSILFNSGYLPNIVNRIIKAIDERNIKLVNELIALIIRKQLLDEKNEVITLLIKKTNEYDPEKDIKLIEYVKKSISILESKSDFYVVPDY